MPLSVAFVLLKVPVPLRAKTTVAPPVVKLLLLASRARPLQVPIQPLTEKLPHCFRKAPVL